MPCVIECDVPYVRPLSDANDDAIVNAFVVANVLLLSVEPVTLHDEYVHFALPDNVMSAEAADTPIATRAVDARRILRMFVSKSLNYAISGSI